MDRVSLRGGRKRQRVGGLHWPNTEQGETTERAWGGLCSIVHPSLSFLASISTLFFLKGKPETDQYSYTR